MNRLTLAGVIACNKVSHRLSSCNPPIELEKRFEPLLTFDDFVR